MCRGGDHDVKTRARKICSCVGCTAHPGSCPQIVPSGRCPACAGAAEARRGTATQRGYSRPHEAFRRAVLARDPVCKMDGCDEPSTDADHFPLDRATLTLRGLNPNDPAHGRGLCGTHHKQETARLQPGGWNRR